MTTTDPPVYNESFSEYISRVCKGLRKKYKPAPWLKTGFMQTVLAGYYHYLPKEYFPLYRQVLSLPNGGNVGIDWMGSLRTKPTSIIMFLPGAGKSTMENGNIITQLMACMYHQYSDVLCGMIIYQNIGGLPLKTLELPGSCYCSTNDLTTVFSFVRKNYPNIPILVIAASVGTAIFSNWAARNREVVKSLKVGPALLLGFGNSVAETVKAIDEYPVIFGCIGPPLSSVLLSKWKQVITDRNGGVKVLHELAEKYPKFSVEKLLSARNLTEWDEACLPAYEFTSLEEMFEACDVERVGMSNYKVPSLFINATDDMLTPPSRLITSDQYKQSHMLMVTTSGGGHLGWIDGAINDEFIGSHMSWMRNIAFEFVEASWKYRTIKLWNNL